MHHKIWFLLICPGLPLGILVAWIYRCGWTRDKQSRRPFLDMPRPAGWSLQNKTEKLVDSFTETLMLCVVTGLLAWAIWLSDSSQLVVALAVGLGACSFFAVRVAKTVGVYANYRLGLLGEQVVGQFLDRLSSDTVRVFHDLEVKEPGNKPWNIDHVVVTPAGVFAIETKCRRKPRSTAPDGQEGHKIIFDGQQLIFPHPMRADRHGLDQASNNATWLSDKLTALNGTPISVAPVLVFPGWWIEAKGKGPVAVLNPKLLSGYFSGRKSILSDQQFRAINAQLEERCRIDLAQPA